MEPAYRDYSIMFLPNFDLTETQYNKLVGDLKYTIIINCPIAVEYKFRQRKKNSRLTYLFYNMNDGTASKVAKLLKDLYDSNFILKYYFGYSVGDRAYTFKKVDI